MAYLVKSAYHQAGLIHNRVPVETALKDPQLSEQHKNKLLLAQKASQFAVSELGLKRSSNYTTFVQLNRPYVTYVVSAASRFELKQYKWWYPIVGSLPYKGFFDPESAKREAEELKQRGYDTYVRGVAAYSTLGWFSDPILSSMLNYKDPDLVDTIIHETTHATIYIKSEADFNERLAVFMGRKGTFEFYKKTEGPDSPMIKQLIESEHDENLFSEFMAHEIKALDHWYKERKKQDISEDQRRERLEEIKTRFKANLRPRFKIADSYKNFDSIEINNARLLAYRLYFDKLDEFEAVFEKLGRDFHKMLNFCKSLEKAKDPKAELTRAAQGQF